MSNAESKSKHGPAFEKLALELLDISEKQLAKLELGKRQGIIELAPVVLPEHPKGDNNHIGWPDGVKTGDVIVVIHKRLPGHNPVGAGRGDADTTFCMAIRSLDQGQTWSESYDLRDAMSPENRDRGGVIPLSHRYKFGPVNQSKQGYKLHLNGIGTTREGAVVVMCNYGVFRSDDQGQSWKHFGEAFREDKTEGDIFYVGPKIIDHPQHGLLAFGNIVDYGRSEKHPNPVDGPLQFHNHNLVVMSSRDGGNTWHKTTNELPEWAAQHNTAAMLHENELFLLGRDELTGRDYVQMRLSKPDGPVKLQRMSMGNKSSIDSPDIDFNPVTKRIEVVHSQRDAGRVELWSIDPQQWDSASWRLEGTLFSRGGDFFRTSDGYHPAAAIIDAQRGVQHIFFYTGHPNGPAGCFRLTRTLETPRLVEFLSE